MTDEQDTLILNPSLHFTWVGNFIQHVQRVKVWDFLKGTLIGMLPKLLSLEGACHNHVLLCLHQPAYLRGGDMVVDLTAVA
jgi:hypothetical protein